MRSCLRLFFIMLLFTQALMSCELTPGGGGTSTITGKVYLKEVNSSGIVTAEYYVAEENVYILYDEDSIYDESTKTSFNGEYQFPFLRRGTYKIFAYTDVNTISGVQAPVSVTVEITDNHQTVEAPDIIIEKK